MRRSDAGVFLAVHENFRFQAPMLKVAEMIASGVIGTPSWARISFRTGYDIYKGQPYFYDEERFAILDVGVHVLDLARVFMGEVERLSCESQRRNPEVRAEDTATMLLRHASGAVSVVEHTYEARKLPDHFPQTLLEIEGPRGAIVVKADFVMEVTRDGGVTREYIGSPLLPWTPNRGTRRRRACSTPAVTCWSVSALASRQRLPGRTISRHTRSPRQPTCRRRPGAR